MSSSKSLRDIFGDVWDPILRLVSRADLVALCLVSQASRATTEAFLYSIIEWTWAHKVQYAPPIACFLRTILQRPALANHVRRVLLLGDVFAGRPRFSIADVDLDAAIGAIQDTELPYAPQWIQSLRKGDMDAFVALLLSRCHRLVQVVVQSNFTEESTHFMGMLFNSAVCTKTGAGLPTFQYLREVAYSLGWHPEIIGKHTKDVLPFFYLPAIRSLSVSLGNPLTLEWPLQPPDPLTITSLELTHMQEKYLGRILSTTRNVKTLRWEWYYCGGTNYTGSSCTIDLTEAFNALQHISGTVEDLTIAATHGMGRGHGNPTVYIKGSLKALIGFDCLRKLSVPWVFLVGWSRDAGIRLADVIPRYIQDLTITDDLGALDDYDEWGQGTDVMPVLELWLRNWKLSTPNLRKFTFYLEFASWEWGPVMRNTLLEVCNQYGVIAEIVKIHADTAGHN